MNINEVVKSFFSKKKEVELSSEVEDDNTLIDTYPNTGAFFDDEQAASSIFGFSKIGNTLAKQKDKIMLYRNLANTPDVTDAVDEIVNEIMFSYDNNLPIKVKINEENDKLVEAITNSFDKISRIANLNRNMYSIVRRSYIDGQIIFHTAYGKNTKDGIQSIKMIEPCMLYFDKKSVTYKYLNDKQKAEYSPEEICRDDFGLYDGDITLSYLDYALKPANVLKTLEDLLIPLRFSRSISRRVFNVDVGDLPGKRSAEVMRDYQSKFKYKKFYNNETGEVSNQQHITSMVEDYWFANRSGGRGTTVDVLDESGNLGELDDILYFAKKLYKALKIPSSRIDINPDADKDFSYDDSRTTKEDLKFFMFISRIRKVYSCVFKDLLKKEVISTGVMTESEWDDKESDISIEFINENSFIEKMKLDSFMGKLDIYSTAQEYAGKLFSVERILNDIFNMSKEEVETEFKNIQSEEKNKLYANFYKDEDY